MSTQSKSLFHTKLSPLLNLHRVMPGKIADMALSSDAPLNSVEGLLRQLIWRNMYITFTRLQMALGPRISKTESLLEMQDGIIIRYQLHLH